MTAADAIERTASGYRLGLATDDVDYFRLGAAMTRAREAANADDWVTALDASESARAIRVGASPDGAVGDLATTAHALLDEAARIEAIARPGRLPVRRGRWRCFRSWGNSAAHRFHATFTGVSVPVAWFHRATRANSTPLSAP